MLSISIVTYNRLNSLKELLDRVFRFTSPGYHLFVADDGSTDGTVQFLKDNGIDYITGENRGLVWNTNRAIAMGRCFTEADYIATMEDDVRPFQQNWDLGWIEAASIWGHINYNYLSKEKTLSGSGSPSNPFWVTEHGSQIICSSRQAVNACGYLDTRYRGFECAHREYTDRMGKFLKDTWMKPRGMMPAINSGCGAVWNDTHFNKKEHDIGLALTRVISQNPQNYRDPFCSADEAQLFAEELNLSITSTPYQNIIPSVYS